MSFPAPPASRARFPLFLALTLVAGCVGDGGVTPGVVSITLTPTAATLEVGKTLALEAAVGGSSDPVVFWRSSDETTATVSQGVVTAKAPGAVTITALPRADTTRRATAQVTVLPTVAVNVAPDTATVGVGRSVTLTATVTGTSTTTVDWRSSNDAVASVAQGAAVGAGLVTGKTEGEATITAISRADTMKRATARVVVRASTPPSASLTGSWVATWNSPTEAPASHELLVVDSAGVLRGFDVTDRLPLTGRRSGVAVTLEVQTRSTCRNQYGNLLTVTVQGSYESADSIPVVVSCSSSSGRFTQQTVLRRLSSAPPPTGGTDLTGEYTITASDGTAGARLRSHVRIYDQLGRHALASGALSFERWWPDRVEEVAGWGASQVGVASIEPDGTVRLEFINNYPAHATSLLRFSGTLSGVEIRGSWTSVPNPNTVRGLSGAGSFTAVRQTGPGRIAFSTDRDGNLEVYTMNPDGTGLVNVTRAPASSEGNPTWTPFGEALVFASDRGGVRKLHAALPDGANPVRLTQGTAEEEWPSAERGLFSTAHCRRAGTTTGVFQVTGERLSPTAFDAFDTCRSRWSPAASPVDLAFSSTRDGNREIYRARFLTLQGGPGTPEVVRLTDHPADDDAPAWSPDGSRIAFQSNRDGNFEIYLMNADGTGVTRLTTHPAADLHPAWSPDGRKIAFASLRDGNHEIYVMNADGSGLVRITNHPGADGAPAWTR